MLLAYKVMLGPVLLYQGRTLRRDALRLPEAEGERAGTTGSLGASARAIRLLFVGDSSAAGVGVAHQDDALAKPSAMRIATTLGTRVHWQLVARTGVNTAEALEMVRASELRPADAVVVALGVNDVTSQQSPGAFERSYRALWGELRQLTGASALVVTGLPPLHVLPAAPQPLRWYLGKYAARLARCFVAGFLR